MVIFAETTLNCIVFDLNKEGTTSLFLVEALVELLFEITCGATNRGAICFRFTSP